MSRDSEPSAPAKDPTGRKPFLLVTADGAGVVGEDASPQDDPRPAEPPRDVRDERQVQRSHSSSLAVVGQGGTEAAVGELGETDARFLVARDVGGGEGETEFEKADEEARQMLGAGVGERARTPLAPAPSPGGE